VSRSAWALSAESMRTCARVGKQRRVDVAVNVERLDGRLPKIAWLLPSSYWSRSTTCPLTCCDGRGLRIQRETDHRLHQLIVVGTHGGAAVAVDLGNVRQEGFEVRCQRRPFTLAGEIQNDHLAGGQSLPARSPATRGLNRVPVVGPITFTTPPRCGRPARAPCAALW
jgi:hypothetical protein